MLHQSEKLTLRQTKSKSQADVYLADDELVLDSNLGRLFVVIEIFSREKKTKDLIRQIITNIEADYYSSPTSDPESTLETVCQNFNSYLPDLINKPKAWLSKFNILVGAVKEDEIFLTSFGKFKTALVRQNKFITIIPEDKEQKKFDGKLLSQLISGKIEPYDVYLFSNPTLFDYFSREKIKKTISSLNPDQSTEYFKNLLLENVNPVSFAAVIFKFDNQKETADNSTQKEYLKDFYGTEESMNNLSDMERKTSKVLRANLMPNLKKMLSATKKISFIKQKKISLDDKVNRKVDLPQESIKPSKQISLRKHSLDLQSKVNQIANLPRNFIHRLKNLNKKHRTLAIFFIVLIFIFISSLFIISQNKKVKVAKENFQEKVSAVEDKINSAEAALIYQDEEAAANNLAEARSLLTAIPQEKDEHTKMYEKLDQKIRVTLDEIYHIYQTEPSLIVDLNQLNSDGSVIELIKNKDNIFALTDNDLLYRINTSENSYTQVSSEANYKQSKNWDDDNLIFLNAENKFTTYNISEDTFSLKPTNFSAYSPEAWNIYTDKIYLVDKTNKQILKISRPLSEAPQISNWFQDDPLILEKIDSLLIDGDIWLTSTDGKIYRMFKGRNQNFTIKDLNKDLGTDIEIYTETDWQKIYVLDKQNSRLILLTKGGSVEKQLKNSKLNECNNLKINNNQTKAWLNCDDKIMEIEL
ncbi:MAG: hypothetical protein ABIA91_02285 [Patescibacteria group bacterium]